MKLFDWIFKKKKKVEIIKPIERDYVRELYQEFLEADRKIKEQQIINSRVWVKPVFDTTPNPLKYWRRFKRGKKLYYKKYYLHLYD